MKKLLQSMMTSVAVLATLAGAGTGTGAATAADKVYTCKFGTDYNQKKINSYTDTWQTKVDDNTWTLVNFNNNNNDWNYVRCGSKNAASVASITTDFAIPEKISEVAVTIDAITADKVNSIKLNTSDTKDFTNPKNSYDVTKATGTQKVAIAEADQAGALYYQLVFDCAKGSKNGLVQVSEITYTGEEVEVAVASPKMELTEGDECFTLSMTCATEGARIYYTEDGTEPTAASTEYTAPVEVWMTTTFKAIAVKGDAQSLVAEFVANPPMIIDGFSALGDFPKDTKVIIKGNMTAVYENGKNLYLRDGMGSYMMVYGNNLPEMGNGDTMTRLEATYSPYNGLPELVSPEFGEIVTGGTPVEPTEVTLDMINATVLNQYYVVRGVKVTEFNDEKIATMTDAEDTVVKLRNQFGLTDAVSGDNCDVTGFVGIFGEDVQFYPIAITEGEVSVELGDLVVTLPGDIVAEDEGSYTLTVGEGFTATCENAEKMTVYILDENAEEYADDMQEGSAIEWRATEAKNQLTVEVTAILGEQTKRVMFTLNAVSGVSNVVAGDGEAVYFNLQGIRVERPAKGGVYIRVAGDKSLKTRL